MQTEITILTSIVFSWTSRRRKQRMCR